MHRSCLRVSRAMGLAVAVRGDLPGSGLIASNHLSYLDILAFASVTPCIFVSKQDVLRWPVFGTLAKFGGTIFINRERRSAVADVSAKVEQALQAGLPVVLFPEGTSTDGTSVLPYYPSLLEAALRCGSTFTPAAVGYSAAGHEEAEFCYYGEIAFARHLLSVLAKPAPAIQVAFGQSGQQFSDRKEAAAALRQQTMELRNLLIRNSSDMNAGTTCRER